MSRIFTLGESILDIIFRDGEVRASRPGGSMLNTAVSLGRLGLDIYMVSELTFDSVGKIILKFLSDNDVDISYVQQYNKGKTPVSIASLDEHNDANYTFFRELPPDRLPGNFPKLKKGDILLFGSFYALDPEINEKVRVFVREAKENGTFIIYDPNIRKNHLGTKDLWMPFLEENLRMADLVRGSDEDFMNVFNLKDGIKIYDHLQNYGCDKLVLTYGSKGADYFAPGIRIHKDVRQIKVVSTIGAGDSFNAGLICALLKPAVLSGGNYRLDNELVNVMLGLGIEFASEVCSGLDNYISRELAQRVRKGF